MANPGDALEKARLAFNVQMAVALGEVGKEITEEMQDTLTAKDHVDFGDLREGLGYLVKREGEHIKLYGYSNARSPEGVSYAEFLEYGTGIYNPESRRNGEPWRYKDKHGVWHTTRGMKADPFIEPAVEKITKKMDAIVSDVVYNIKQYRR